MPLCAALAPHPPSPSPTLARALGAVCRALANVVSFSFSHNSIGDAGAIALLGSGGLGHCPRLASVVVKGCGISGSSGVFGSMLSTMSLLDTLVVDDNPLGNPDASTLFAALKHAPALTTLSVSGCAIGDSGAKSLSAAIRRGAFPCLSDLKVARNGLSDISLATLCDTLIRSNSSLAVFDVSGNTFTNASSGALAAILRCAPSIRDLDAGGCSLSAEGAATLAAEAACAPLLQRLVLDCPGGLAYAGFAALQTSLKDSQIASLTTLSVKALQDTSRSPEGFWKVLPSVPLSVQGVLKLGALLATSGLPKLAVLQLGGAGIGDAGAKELAKALRSGCTPEMTVLDLSGNSIGADGACALGAALPALRWLRSLDISSNPAIGDAGMVGLASSLYTVTLLEELSTSGCSISDVGGIALFTALTSASMLLSLDIGRNLELGRKAMAALSALMASDGASQLRHVSLASSSFKQQSSKSVASCVSLLRSFGNAERLETIDLDCCNLCDGAVCALAESLFRLPRLSQLRLSGNNVADECGAALAEALRRGAAPALRSLTLGAGSMMSDACASTLQAVARDRHFLKLELPITQLVPPGASASQDVVS
jgi:Ran GTPase-activating protein (RanGAP) involved in mRNA processing and transport